MANPRDSKDSSGDATSLRSEQETVILSTPVELPGPKSDLASGGLSQELAAETAGGEPPTNTLPSPAAGIVRHGPGVPAILSGGRRGRTAEHIWGGGTPPAHSVRRLGGWAITSILIVASGIVLFLRFHHVPLHVTGAAITVQKAAGCRADVAGRVTTNGAAGTITYRWQFKPGGQQATTLHQTIAHGQHAADLVITLEVSGHGSSAQTAVLEVLSPDPRTASIPVVLTC